MCYLVKLLCLSMETVCFYNLSMLILALLWVLQVVYKDLKGKGKPTLVRAPSLSLCKKYCNRFQLSMLTKLKKPCWLFILAIFHNLQHTCYEHTSPRLHINGFVISLVMAPPINWAHNFSLHSGVPNFPLQKHNK